VNRRRHFLQATLVIVALVAAGLGEAAELVRLLDGRPTNAVPRVPLLYWHETRQAPRPVQIHCLRLELRSPAIQLAAAIGPDPDGAGPAEAQLVNAAALAATNHFVAAVNANAFAEVPPPPDGRTKWRAGLPVDIIGWARDNGRDRSPPQSHYFSFWLDPRGRGRTGSLATNVPAQVAVAGFGDLVRDGKRIPVRDETLHPRTAVGANRDGTVVWFVVVDGRQRGYSEGVSTCELADLLLELGCDNAINLDGGGSSILLLAPAGDALRTMNRPSDPLTRPVPVLLGVRRR
jgi:hypothetical protein